MNRKSIIASCVALLAAHPGALFACAACYGQSDSAMAKGMNWAIFALMGVIVLVLGTLGAFFVFLATRPAMTDDQKPADDNRENHSEGKHGTV